MSEPGGAANVPARESRLWARKRSGGFGYWLGALVGDYRLDIYWEPINGWRHWTFRCPCMAWVGPVLIIGQNWRAR